MLVLSMCLQYGKDTDVEDMFVGGLFLLRPVVVLSHNACWTVYENGQSEIFRTEL